MKHLALIILISIIAANSVWGKSYHMVRESQKYPSEELVLHLTNNCLFPGEALWFKVYCVSPLYPKYELSKMAYVELINSDNASLLRKKIVLNQGEGEGEFIIPGKIKTGVYYILAYTNWMKNYGERSFFRNCITIINPDQEFEYIDEDSLISITEIKNSEKAFEEEKIKISTSAKSFGVREKVNVNVDCPNLVKYSVSVNRKIPDMHSKYSFNNQYSLEIGSIDYLPDYKGVRLSGNVTDALGNSVGNKKIILSYPGQGTDLKSVKTDDKGDFHFLLKPGQGLMDVVLTLPDSNLKLKLEESFWNGFRNQPGKLFLAFNDRSIEFLKEKFAHYQLQNKFKQQHFDQLDQTDNRYRQNWIFYGKPDQVIEMSDYITLDSLTEYFWELVPSVKFVQRRGNFTISIVDPVTYLPFEDLPGVFVDGVLYDDYNEIAHIPVEDVRQIAVTAKTYYYRNFTFGGIVDIHTKKGDFNAVKLLPNMERVMFPLGSLPSVKNNVPDYVSSVSLSEPDLRYMICWLPEMLAEESSKNKFEFYTSDVEGDYVIKIVGVAENGEIVKGTQLISVKADLM